MRSEDEIRRRINKLKVRLDITAKHHDKYVDLYHRVKHSWKDVFSSRLYKYHSKCTELYGIWQDLTPKEKQQIKEILE